VQRDLAAATNALRDVGWSAEDLADLREFVTASPAVDPPDPAFKERLRLDLWWLIVTRWTAARRDGPRS
jgi:hypothetical protein